MFEGNCLSFKSGRFMRIIGGTHRGRQLRTLAGSLTRPTSDRLRETLFNILAPRINDSRFLDICAGSGAVGIEALSRGASEVTFIERSRDACAVIEANLKTLGIAERGSIQRRSVSPALKAFEQASGEFDIVFFDPPYSSSLYDDVMAQLGSGDLIVPGGVVVVEHRAKAPLQPRYDKLHRFREVKQGDSALSLYSASLATPR
jgi:16S rRNA (guanine966-N2)-methyltransferase